MPPVVVSGKETEPLRSLSEANDMLVSCVTDRILFTGMLSVAIKHKTN